MQSIAGVMMEGEPEGRTDGTDTKHEIGQITKHLKRVATTIQILIQKHLEVILLTKTIYQEVFLGLLHQNF